MLLEYILSKLNHPNGLVINGVISKSHEAAVSGHTSFVFVIEDSLNFVSFHSHHLYSYNVTKCLEWCNFLPWLFLFSSEIQQGKTL